MGCAQSRIEDEEEVARCKKRKQLMRDAVAARNAFAAAHSGYMVCLKDTGAALGEFGQDDAYPVHDHPLPSSAAVALSIVKPPVDKLPPPPPPLPDFSPSPLYRSASMPEMPQKFTSKLPKDSSAATIQEEEDGDEPDDSERRATDEAAGSASPATPPPLPIRSQPQPTPPMPPPPQPTHWDFFFATDESIPGPSLGEPQEIQPEKEKFAQDKGKKPAAPTFERDAVMMINDEPPVTPKKVEVKPPPPLLPRDKELKQGGGAHHQHAASTSALETKKVKIIPAAKPTISLLQMLNEVDDHFLKASESASEVSKMLNCMHYHSNFDNQGYIDSAHVLKVITWSKSLKDTPNADGRKDGFNTDGRESLATVLDKILAWEKKLCDEVKAYELMKFEYQRKAALLNKQKKRGATPQAMEKTKVAVSHLHTRYMVAMQSVDTTVSEIQHLCDNQLYPNLLHLVNGMDKMWEAMYMHHDSQLKIVSGLRALDISNAPREMSMHHYEQTVQLWQVVSEWHLQFEKLMNYQKEYIQALNSWLKLNLIPTESSLKEKAMSPPRVHKPPIQALLHAWDEHLKKLPYDRAKSAIISFAAVINTIMLLQQDELKQKEKCEEIQKEYRRKVHAFEDWYHKYSQRAEPSEAVNSNNSEAINQKDPMAEKKFAVEELKSKLDDEMEAQQRLCKQVREKSFVSLKIHLLELFQAMSDFSLASSRMHKNLKSIPQTQSSVAAD